MIADERASPGARLARFRSEYGAHRAEEGRGRAPDELVGLPYLCAGPLARQWGVRARSYDAFMRLVVRPLAARHGRALRILDLGAGNGWLSRRAALAGHRAVALDLREDAVDGLGAASHLLASHPGLFHRVAASFDRLPFAPRAFDLAVFNASLHYAFDLGAVIGEQRRAIGAGDIAAEVEHPYSGQWHASFLPDAFPSASSRAPMLPSAFGLFRRGNDKCDERLARRASGR